MTDQTTPATASATQNQDENVEYEYVEVPEGEAVDGEYEYVEVPAGDDDIQYEYVEAPADGSVPDGAEYEYVEVPQGADNIQYEYVESPEIPAVPAEAPVAEESGAYEYAAPAADGEQYEYVEVPADENGQPVAEESGEYEYVEVPAGDTAAPTAETAADGEQYEYVEVPADENGQPVAGESGEYEYVEVPESEAAAPVATAPAPEQPIEESGEYEYAEIPAGEENVEYEYVEVPEGEAVDGEQYEYVEMPAEAPAPETTAAAEEETPATAEAEPESAPAPEPETPETAAEEPAVTAAELETPADAVFETAQTQTVEKDAPADTAETETVSENTAAIDALAAETVAARETPEETAEIVAEETQEESDEPSAENDMLPPTGAFSFDGAIAASFVGKDGADTVVLNNSAHAFDRLSEWYLLVSEFSVTPLIDQTGAEIPLSDDVFCQGAFVNPDGSAETFVNDLSLTVPNGQTALALCGVKAVGLAGQENSTIELEGASGMLIGPNGAQLLFTRLNKLVIPDLPPAKRSETEQNQVSETSNEPVTYALPQESAPESGVFSFAESDGERRTDAAVISIKTGYSPYGWNVTFKNGQTMSLADVRTYQTKHGVLPDTSGTVAFKRARLVFENARKIRVYEKPAYCGYGKKPQ